MSTSKDKTFPEKFKSFFKTLKGGAPPRARGEEYVILTEELEAELQSAAPLANRIKAIKELTESCKNRRAELHVIEKVWTLVNDLFRFKDGQAPAKETRHLTFGLLIALCQSPLDKSGAMRAKLFTFVKSHDNPEDILPRFNLLQSLTDNGKDVSYFEERIGPLLHDWMADRQIRNIPVAQFMSFLVNVIKFNYTFLDHDILNEIIRNVCFVSCTCSSKDDICECLNVLNVVLGYGKLPPGCLPNFLATLCRTVNVDTLCPVSWTIMKNLLGTHLGHSGIFQMCNFMENSDRCDDVSVVRGAVFFVGASLWGSKTIRSLKYSPNSVLNSFDRALNKKNALITFEVMLRVQDLVKCNSEGLQTITWDLILQITAKSLSYTTSECLKEDPSAQAKIMKAVNDTLDLIEAILYTKSFCGQISQFYKLIDSCYLYRPIASVEKLMDYKVSNQLHTGKPAWFLSLVEFAEKHLKQEVRPIAKAKAMPLITKICLANRDIYEEDLISRIILPHMKNLENESDPSVRLSGVNFLVDFLMESSSKKGHDLLHILDKIVNRPYENAQTSPDTVHIYSESEVDDILKAVEGIVKLFKRKIYHLPSSIAVSAYKSLVKHLGNHYKKPAVLDNCYSIRYKIFDCFFEIRANSLYHLGFPVTGAKCLTFSSYLAVDHRDGDEKLLLDETNPGHNVNIPLVPSAFQSSSPGVTFISLTAACKLVVGSLKKEKDWNVLQLVLQSLPTVLENKALILSKHGNDIDYLATALCCMIQDSQNKSIQEKALNLPESLKNCPQMPKLSRADFQAYLYPIFQALVSYHSHLDIQTQQKIVRCLQQGLSNVKCCRSCILALTVCTLEMKDTMHKLGGEVLLALSKITPRVVIAIPVLEFLSTLLHLPRVFASFVENQYMSIFAIALPYTNPFKFNQYTVSLAHHVIAMWFLKCRLSYRRQFVSYIIKGLEANVWGPMEEESRRYAQELKNEDSSNRQRSSSLTDNNRKRRDRPISGQANPGQRLTSFDSKAAADKSLQNFHQELTETCLDFMTRYAYADCSCLPTRFATTNFLIEGGLSQSWMIDNRIITITTSGCSQKELKDGVCDKCYLICRKQRSNEDSKLTSHDGSPSLGRSVSVRESTGAMSANSLAKRRRHVSAFADAGSFHSKRFDSIGKLGMGDSEKREAKDDLHLEQQRNREESSEESNMGNSTLLGGSSPFISDFSHKTKSDTFLCTCWCAGWAEVLIRTPTGNTSWMMRVQNQIGNNNTADIPIRDLSSMYLQNIVEPCQTESESFMSSATSSTLSSPTHTHQPLLSSQPLASTSQDSVLAGIGSGGTVSPNIPGTPTTPEEEDCDHMGKKNPVQRSVSSPEMSSTWKPSQVNLQKDIEEQDEDETLVVSSLKPVKAASLEVCENAQSTSPNEAKESSSSSSGMMKGSMSPFRRSYEAIPEENVQRSGSLTGSPESINSEAFKPMKRDRVSTISVMTPVSRNQVRRILSWGSGESSTRESRLSGASELGIRSGVSPGFVFLQLCSQGVVGKGERPIPLPSDEQTAKSLRVLDYIPPYETHKIGVVYVGHGQSKNEMGILQNQYGSSRYRDFLQGLGSLIKLKEIDLQKVFTGGLAKDGQDGDFACIWQDDVMQVIFHVATLMPNKVSDPNGNCKKRHIGNDFVAIVYNNSDEEYDINTIKAQFLYAWVIITPLDHRTNRVVVKALPVLADHIGHTEAKIVSDQNLPTLARQLALHSNLASVIFQKMQAKNSDPYASNWLERLRNIKRLRSRLIPDSGINSSEELSNDGLLPITSMKRQLFEDFTEFV